MRTRYASVLLALVAVFALSVVASASATPVWKVEGHALAAGETEAISSAVTVKQHFLIGQTTGWKAECSTLAYTGAKLKGPNGFTAASMKFSGCVTKTHSAQCEVGEGGQFSTREVSGTLEGSTSVALKITPTSAAGEFALLSIRSKPGQSCIWQQESRLKGYMLGEIPTPTVEATGHALSFKEPSGLVWDEQYLGFTGEVEMTLASGKKWSA